MSGWQALAVIEGAGEALPPKVIGERLLLTSGSITSLLDTVERRGMVRREPHPDDRRKLLVDITPEARKLVGLMLAQVHQTSVDVMAGISEADREQAIQTLAKIRANVEAMASRPVPPVTMRRRTARPPSDGAKRANWFGRHSTAFAHRAGHPAALPHRCGPVIANPGQPDRVDE